MFRLSRVLQKFRNFIRLFVSSRRSQTTLPTRWRRKKWKWVDTWTGGGNYWGDNNMQCLVNYFKKVFRVHDFMIEPAYTTFKSVLF